MRYIDTFREGMHIADVYLCKNKQIALTKNGKEYGNLVMQDKTGTIDAKIWDLGSPGVGEFETMDYVHVEADVTQGAGGRVCGGRLPAGVKEGYKENVRGAAGIHKKCEESLSSEAAERLFCGERGICKGVPVPFRS